MSGYNPFAFRIVYMLQFDKKLCWVGSERDAMDKNLDDLGWHCIDELLLNPIMRLNSIDGVSTFACCSGHPGNVKNGYISFKRVTPEIIDLFNTTHYWRWDTEDAANGKNVVRISEYYCECLLDWINALRELHDVTEKFELKFNKTETI